MRSPRTLILAVAAGALIRASPAPAATPRVELGLGADWLTSPRDGAFQLTLAGDNRLNGTFSLGGRIGLLVLTDPSRLGVPLDVRLRGRFGRIYVDGVVGPWLVFSDDDPLRFHGAVGFGLLMRNASVGLEVGYLDPTSMVGLRMAFPL